MQLETTFQPKGRLLTKRSLWVSTSG